MDPVTHFRARIASGDLLVCPVVADPLSARLAQRAGAPVALLGGFGVSAVRFGLPDTGLITFSDMLDHLRNTCDAVPGYPIVGDGDTGYGNAMNVRRTVAEYARAGAAAILLEDQLWPKKCGHYGGARKVISRDEARMKIRAAVEARGERDIAIVARTDARSAEGMNEAMERCRIFREEGADLLFIEALTGVEEMRTFAGSFRGTWANMMPKTPPVSRADLKAMGFTVVTYNVVLAAAVHAMRAALHALVADSPERTPPLMPFDDLTELVGLNDYVKLEQHYGLPDEPQ